MPRRPPRRTTSPVRAYLTAIDQFWRDHIACKTADPALFDPADESERFRLYPPRAVEASRVCDGCPVSRECLVDALAMGDRGVRGGQWIGRHGTPIPIAPLPRRRVRRTPAA